MAIHPAYPGLSVVIVCAGEALPEYDGENISAKNEVVKYVEAKCGTSFRIRIKLEEPFQCDQDLEIKIFVDGSLISRRVTKRESRRLFRPGGYTADHIVVGVDKAHAICRKLRFANSIFSAEASNENANSESIGTIKLSLAYGKMGATDKSKIEQYELVTAEALPMTASERHPLELQATYGKQYLQSPHMTFAPFESNGAELTTFIFKYRSRADLMVLGTLSHIRTSFHVPERRPSASSYSLESTPVIEPRSSLTAIKTDIESHDITPAPTIQQLKRLPLQVPAYVPQRAISASSQEARDQSSPAPIGNEQDGLTTEELIVMITCHRGHDRGLANKSKKSLLALLKFYENKDTEVTPTVQESASVTAESSHIIHESMANETGYIHAKREPVTNDGNCGNGKRRKIDIIVLDD